MAQHTAHDAWPGQIAGAARTAHCELLIHQTSCSCIGPLPDLSSHNTLTPCAAAQASPGRPKAEGLNIVISIMNGCREKVQKEKEASGATFYTDNYKLNVITFERIVIIIVFLMQGIRYK